MSNVIEKKRSYNRNRSKKKKMKSQNEIADDELSTEEMYKKILNAQKKIAKQEKKVTKQLEHLNKNEMKECETSATMTDALSEEFYNLSDENLIKREIKTEEIVDIKVSETDVLSSGRCNNKKEIEIINRNEIRQSIYII